MLNTKIKNLPPENTLPPAIPTALMSWECFCICLPTFQDEEFFVDTKLNSITFESTPAA